MYDMYKKLEINILILISKRQIVPKDFGMYLLGMKPPAQLPTPLITAKSIVTFSNWLFIKIRNCSIILVTKLNRH